MTVEDLDGAMRDLAVTLNTGTPPGKPDAPYVPRYMTGTVTVSANTGCSVDFGSGVTVAALPYLNGPPPVGAVVLVMQLPHQRLIMGVIGATPWHEVGAVGEPAFLNSWVNLGGGFQNAGYMRDAAGFVHLKGLVRAGAIPNTIFTLPVGFRPASWEIAATASNDLFGEVRVDPTNGNVIPYAGSGTWFTLDSTIFRAA